MQEREIFFERHPDPMWVYDVETFQFLDVNNAAVAAYGYSRDEFLAMTTLSIRPPEDVGKFVLSHSVPGQGRRESGTWRHVKKSGEILYAQITAYNIEWKGRRAQMVSVRDATRAVQTAIEQEVSFQQEAVLRKVAEAAAEQFERLFSAVPGNLMVVAPGSWTILAVSDAFLEATRREKPQLLGRSLFDVLPDRGETPQAVSALQLRASLEKVVETGKPDQPGVLYFPLEVDGHDPSDTGHRLWIGVNTPVPAGDGSISYIMCTLEDVTTIIAGSAATGTSYEIIEQARRAFRQQDLPYLRTTLDLRSALARLAEQNSTLRTAQRLIRIGIWKYELWSDHLIWSPEMREIYGVSDEAFGDTFDAYAALVHPEDREDMARNFTTLVEAGGAMFEFEHRVVRPDGRTIHVRGVGEFTDTPEGRLLTGVAQDITRQVEQDNRLHLLDESVRRLNDIVLIFEAATGPGAVDAPVVYVNPSFLRTTGLEHGNVLGQPISKVMSEAAPGVEPGHLVEAISNPVSLRADIRLFTRDGNIVPAEMDLVPVKGLSGALTHWVAVIRDMSEKKAAEERARSNEERYQMLARSTHDVVWDWDFKVSSISWNENFRQLAGDTGAPLIDTPASWIDRLHPDDRERVLEGFYGAALGDAETWSDEYRFLRDDGDVRFVFDRGFISRDMSGKAERIVGSMVDVTSQKLAEGRLAQAEKLEALGQITGGVAHDFNNLLMIIMGNTETLLARTRDTRERQMLDLVLSAAERGRDLTGQLLAFARRIPLKPALLDLNEQAERTAELLRRTFRSNILIQTDLHAGDAAIVSDPAQLELVLLNLAVNARDAMPDGGVLTLATQLVAEDGANRVLLTASDTGEGMDAETLRRCLEPFFTTKPVGRGVGLGLSMVFGFMDQSGGKLQISSEPGKGTCVSLIFPQAERMPVPASRDTIDAPLGGHEHILLIEDDAGVRGHVERVLAELGYRVTVCKDPDEAFLYLEEGGGADLILSDLMMPGSRDIRDIVRRARERFPQIEVLYSSGYPSELIERYGRLAADIDLLPKPYRREELARKLREMLDRQAAVLAARVQAADV